MQSKNERNALIYQRPALIARVQLYDRSDGRAAKAPYSTKKYICFLEYEGATYTQIATLQLGGRELKPGESRAVGFCFS